MTWFYLSIISAFLSACVTIIRKKLTTKPGLENTIGGATFFLGGLFLFLVYFVYTGHMWPRVELSKLFWQMTVLHIVLEVVAVWFLLRALHYAEASYVSPMQGSINIFVLIASYFILGEKISMIAIFGFMIIILGVILINWNIKDISLRQKNIKGLYFLSVTIICWTFTPLLRKVALAEISFVENGPLFFAYLLSILIGLAYIILIYLFKEQKQIRKILNAKRLKNFLFLLFIVSIIYALSAWTHYAALNITYTAYATIIKNISPVFVFLISLFYLQEKNNKWFKFIATILLIIGSVILALN